MSFCHFYSALHNDSDDLHQWLPVLNNLAPRQVSYCGLGASNGYIMLIIWVFGRVHTSIDLANDRKALAVFSSRQRLYSVVFFLLWKGPYA